MSHQGTTTRIYRGGIDIGEVNGKARLRGEVNEALVWASSVRFSVLVLACIISACVGQHVTQDQTKERDKVMNGL